MKWRLFLLHCAFLSSAPNGEASSSLSLSPASSARHGRDNPSRDEDVIPAIDDADASAIAQKEEWRRSLPRRLRERKGAPLHRVDMDGVILYVLGTAHVSRDSCDDARLLVEHVRPDVVFLELCSQRIDLLLDPPAPSGKEQQSKQSRRDTNVSPLSHRGSLLYAKIQADYATKLNVTIGGEFREAFRSALGQQRSFWESQESSALDLHYSQSQPNPSTPVGQHDSAPVSQSRGDRPCAVILGDRPVRITLLRAWESLRMFGKLRLMLALLWSSIFQPSEEEIRKLIDSALNDRTGENDLITKAMEELGRAFPSLKRAIIDERDEYMAAKLMQTAEAIRGSFDIKGAKVIVAVVGAGHCPGLLDKLTRKVPDELDEAERPESILRGLVETRKRKVSNDEEVASTITDLVQFDYSFLSNNDVQ